MKARERSVAIYVLIDPRTNRPRYVGRTVAPLGKRLAGHVSEAKCSLRGLPRFRPSAKCEWITSLKKRGKVPVIRVVQRVKESAAANRELHWICQLRRDGARLVNYLAPRFGKRRQPVSPEVSP